MITIMSTIVFVTITLAGCGSKKSSDDTTTTTNSASYTELQTIINSKCATSGCHASGANSGDWVTSESAFKTKLSSIKSDVANNTMPKAGSTALTTEEKAKFAAYTN